MQCVCWVPSFPPSFAGVAQGGEAGMVFGCTGLEIKAEDFGKGIEGLKGTCRVEVDGLTR